MAQDDVQKHLDTGRYGTPQVNPDEQKKYLGTFRERCFLSMTIKEMKDLDYQAAVKAESEKHPEARLLINGGISDALQQKYIALATKAGIEFTIVSDATADSEDQIGLLLVTDHAVDEPVIDVAKKYPEDAPKTDSEADDDQGKADFWSRLFK